MSERLLLDTHVILAIVQKELPERFPEVARMLSQSTTTGYVSVASLWEIAIKTRLGKLAPSLPLLEIPDFLAASGLAILNIEAKHATTATDPEPETRDPFDRLLLAQCQIEGLRLVTIDRALVDHPVAMKL